jgi:lysophospholipase L1-like esterase
MVKPEFGPVAILALAVVDETSMKLIHKLIGALLAMVVISAASAESTNALSNRRTLWLIGDSTVRNNTRGQQGWGDPIAKHFDTNRIRVMNRALGGRSSRTFYTEGLWEKVREQLKPGDFVIMQFGHNDGGGVNANKSRGSLKGVGDETQEITKTNGTTEVVHTFGWYLRNYVRDTKAKGATPIVCSLIPRNDWKDGKVLRAANGYGGFAAAVAKEEDVPFIDLNEIIARKYEAEGPEAVTKKYFLNEHTHTTPAGAELNAACVVEGIRGLKDCSLVGFLHGEEAGSVKQLPK